MLLLKMNGAKAVYFHSPVTGAARTARKILDETGVPDSRPLLKLRKEKNTAEAEIPISGFEGIRFRMIRSENTGLVLEILFPSGEILRRNYPFSTERIVERIPLKTQKRAAF